MPAYFQNQERISLRDNRSVKPEDGKWDLQPERQWYEAIGVFLVLIPLGILMVYVSLPNLN
jgi:hypothetical protein